MEAVTVVGAGLAGCEAAWQLAERGIPVRLMEMKPQKMTPLAEALRPALSWLLSSPKSESWSPAQSMGVVCAPV